MTRDAAVRLIDNAILARDNCKKSGSEWGVLYWETVYRALVRKFDRMN